MKRVLFSLTVFLVTMPVHADEFWGRLWRNADQEGDVLLQRGDARGAANVYVDPRRKGYAQLKAGDYKGAALTLGKLHDNDADYNRGNALAHMGDLEGALRAYDAALQQKPNDKDARHNRDLVANALKKQPADNKSQDDQNKDRQNSSAQSNAQQGQDRNNSRQKSDQPGKDQNDSGQKQAGQDASAGRQSTQHDQQSDKGGSAAAQQPYADNDKGKTTQNAAMPGEADTETSSPKSEQQIEEAQWLHSIPDDPGGLLRRKFLIEHMIRQQRGEQ